MTLGHEKNEKSKERVQKLQTLVMDSLHKNDPTSITEKYPKLYLKYFNGVEMIVGPHTDKDEKLEIPVSSLLNKGEWAGRWVPYIVNATFFADHEFFLNKPYTDESLKQWYINEKDVMWMFDQKFDMGFVFSDPTPADIFRVMLFIKYGQDKSRKLTDNYEY